ncbi:FG-GAP-like repeat-containing protein, partial [Microcoleus sp. T2B6]|uniref:FG-GAP-like repeat-containing protein n=1 Tax=Microcoleus sp. T2B6 TaxID=3055424 RepID=UPI002FD26762
TGTPTPTPATGTPTPTPATGTPTPTPATGTPTPTPATGTPTPTPATGTPTPTPVTTGTGSTNIFPIRIPNSNARIAALGDPTVSFSQATYKVNESSTGVVPAEITLTRTGTAEELNKISKVYLEEPTGSATLRTDWKVSPNFSPEITFNPGENSKTFTINILSDGQAERTEKIEFRITARDKANIGEQGSATLQIFDADGLFTDTNVPISGLDSAIWGDYNNDGKLDILGGSTPINTRTFGNRFTPITRIYNNTNQGFSEANRRDLPGQVPVWGDYNNDGWLDAGLINNDSTNISSYEINRNELNSGGDFTVETRLPDYDISYDIYRASWADYNNDGRPDLFVNKRRLGPQNSFSTTLYRNTGDIGSNRFEDSKARLKEERPDLVIPGRLFSDGPTGGPTKPGVWADYDNDGKLDILVQVKDSKDINSRYSAKLYRNLGDGVFEDTRVDLPGFGGEARDMAWGDYNNDGQLDILLSGSDSSLQSSFTKVYRNKTRENKGSASFEDIGAQIPSLGSARYAWGDYDNDGFLDILGTGVDQQNGASSATIVAKLYRNERSFSGPNSFKDSGVQIDSGTEQKQNSFSQTAWGDYDKDGRLDILLTGASPKDFSGSYNENDFFTKVFRNNTVKANTPPTAPTELTALPSSREVTFNWKKATDDHTPADGLSYNLRVGTTPGGQDILSPMSYLADGTRQLVGLGNVSQNTKWQLKDLSPNKKYYWSVQAIDTAWAGSKFAEEGSFTTVANNPPVVNRSVFSQSAALRFSQTGNTFTLAADTNTDPDPGDSINYSIAVTDYSALNESAFKWKTDLNGGSYRQPIPDLSFPEIPLPSWLTFNRETRTINLGPDRPKSFRYWLKVTGTDKSGASVSEFVQFKSDSLGGFVIDAYIAGATLFLDANKNGIKDTNEPSTTTDSKGEFNLNIPFETFDTNKNGEIDPSEGNLVATGGTDTATGLPLETPVTAPPDASVVTLLTTLVADLIDKGIEPEEAQSLVKAALSLPADVDLTSFDPIEATNNNIPGGVQVLAEMVKVQNFITQTSGLIDGASSAVNSDIVKAVVSSMTAQIQSGTVLNLSNAAALEPIIQQTAAKIQQIDPSFNSQTVTKITSQAATVMATANQRIDAAVSNPTGTSIPESLARLQQVALGPTTQEFKEVGTGNKPISQLVADNTGTALDSRIEAVVLPVGIATPVVSGDADLGSNSPDAILGTNGDDILTGDSANNVLMGMRGNDSLDGVLGNDTIFGGKGSDTILGSSGDDVLFGNRGADLLNGDDGNDILYGGKGDDLLNGGLGIDSLIGGMGVDKFLLSTNSGTDTINDFEVGQDLLVLGNGLSFSQLAIAQDSGATLIRLAQTGEILASLAGVSASSISAVNFGLI